MHDLSYGDLHCTLVTFSGKVCLRLVIFLGEFLLLVLLILITLNIADVYIPLELHGLC